jgi:signal transduction histidine kinase
LHASRTSAGPLTRIGHYLVAFGAVLLSTAFRGLLFSELGVVAPLTTYCAAVMVAAWYGGWGPGLFATALSILAGVSFFPRRLFPESFEDEAAVWTVVFTVVCLCIMALDASSRRARWRAEEQSDARERATFALAESEGRIRQQQARLLVLADVSQVLAHAGLELERVSRTVVERLAESVGDLCVLRLLSADGTKLEAAAFHHRDAEAAALLGPSLAAVPSDAGLLGQVLATRREIWRPQISAAELLRDTPREDLRPYLDRVGLASLVITPLLASGTVLGTLALLRDGRGPEFTAEDRDLVTALASRAAAAVENARLMRDEQAARAQAEAANRLKDEFLATLSHELRTPLNAIVGWTELLRGGELDEPTMHRALETIARNARIQTELVNDVLDVSRIVSGQFRIKLDTVALPAVVEAALETVRPAAEAKGVALEVHIAPDLWSVAGDASRLQQAAWNLLSNAVKFTPAGGQVAIRLQNAHGRVELAVADTGGGIDAAFLPHVFERFRQGDASTTRVHGGLGLGLAIVRHIVELHGGVVDAQSDGHGRGATFLVKLPAMALTPADLAPPQAQGPPVAPKPPPEPPGPRAT